MKNKSILYTKDFTVEEGIIIPQEAYKSIVRSHTKRYHNCLYLLAGMNPCARNLMDFLAEKMDGNNIINSNEYIRSSFKEFIYEASNNEVNYSESSIKKAFANLTEKGLLRKVARGVYKVNPNYFIKNDDAKRVELVRIELEFKEGIDTKLEIIKKENKLEEHQPYIDETD